MTKKQLASYVKYCENFEDDPRPGLYVNIKPRDFLGMHRENEHMKKRIKELEDEITMLWETINGGLYFD